MDSAFNLESKVQNAGVHLGCNSFCDSIKCPITGRERLIRTRLIRSST